MTEVATPQKFTREIDLGDGSGKQVFEADSQEALADKLAEAQRHATAKIRQQAEELRQANEKLAQIEAASAESEPAPSGFDREGYFNTLYQDPLKAFDIAMEQRFGMPVDQLKEKLAAMEQATQSVNYQSVNVAFATKHPELLQVAPADDQYNAQQLYKIIEESGWTYNERNLEAAYQLAKAEGKLKLPPPPAEEVPAPRPPATLGSQGTSAPSVNEAELFKTMTLEQRREYLIQKAARLRASQ